MHFCEKVGELFCRNKSCFNALVDIIVGGQTSLCAFEFHIEKSAIDVNNEMVVHVLSFKIIWAYYDILFLKWNSVFLIAIFLKHKIIQGDFRSKTTSI